MMFQLVEVSNTVRKIERGLSSFCLLLIDVLHYLFEQQNISKKSCVSFFDRALHFQYKYENGWYWENLTHFMPLCQNPLETSEKNPLFF